MEELILPCSSFNLEGFLVTFFIPRVQSDQNVWSFSRNSEILMGLLCLLLHGLEQRCPAMLLILSTHSAIQVNRCWELCADTIDLPVSTKVAACCYDKMAQVQEAWFSIWHKLSAFGWMGLFPTSRVSIQSAGCVGKRRQWDLRESHCHCHCCPLPEPAPELPPGADRSGQDVHPGGHKLNMRQKNL